MLHKNVITTSSIYATRTQPEESSAKKRCGGWVTRPRGGAVTPSRGRPYHLSHNQYRWARQQITHASSFRWSKRLEPTPNCCHAEKTSKIRTRLCNRNWILNIPKSDIWMFEKWMCIAAFGAHMYCAALRRRSFDSSAEESNVWFFDQAFKFERPGLGLIAILCFELFKCYV